MGIERLDPIERKVDLILAGIGQINQAATQAEVQRLVDPVVSRLQKIEDSIFAGHGVGLRISSASIANILQSTNYVEGVSGWRIYKSGDVEFQNGIFRGDITADSGFFSGTVYIGAAPDRIVIDGPAKSIHSEDYVLGVSGWNIDGDGSVEFQDAFLRGEITALSGHVAEFFYVGLSPNRIVMDGVNRNIWSSNFVTGQSGWRIQGTGDAEFRDVTVRGNLKATVFTYNEINAIAGSQYIVPSAATLRANATATGTTFNIDIKDPETGHLQLFSVGDVLRVKDGTTETWMSVDSVSDQTTFFRYTVSYESGSNSATYRTGTAVLSYGQSGDGGLWLNADSSNGPFIQVFTHAGAPWSAVTERVRIGNLNGWGSFSSDVFGFALGDFAAGNYIYFDPSTDNTRFKAADGAFQIDKDGPAIEGSALDGAWLRWTTDFAEISPSSTSWIARMRGHEFSDDRTVEIAGLGKTSADVINLVIATYGNVLDSANFNQIFARFDGTSSSINLQSLSGNGSPFTGKIRFLTRYNGASPWAATDSQADLIINPSGINLRGAGATVDEFSTDSTLAGNSNTALPTEAATNTALPLTVVEGRLSLTSATPITQSDVTAATTLYFTPFNGSRLRLYNGTNWTMRTFTEVSASLSGLTANTNYDVFIYDSSGTLTLDLVAWTNNTTRATALTLQDGVLVKSGATARLYLGTIRITGTTGQVEDSATKRFVWNNYNRQPRELKRFNGSSHTYTTAAWRAFNNSQTNSQIEFVLGLAQQQMGIVGAAMASVSSNNWNVGFGFDTTAGNGFDTALSSSATGFAFQTFTGLWANPSIGYHFICINQFGANPSSTYERALVSTTVYG